MIIFLRFHLCCKHCAYVRIKKAVNIYTILCAIIIAVFSMFVSNLLIVTCFAFSHIKLASSIVTVADKIVYRYFPEKHYIFVT